MANARLTRGISPNSQFGRDLRALTAKATAKKLEAVARLAEAEFDRIVSAEFVNDRSPERRKTGRHLLGSSNCRVEWDGVGFPVVISLGSTTEGKKLGALNYGSPAHTIRGNPKLSFPVAQKFNARTDRASAPKASKFAAAYAKNSVVVNEVNAPALKGHHMMERALERAVQATYGQSVKAKPS